MLRRCDRRNDLFDVLGEIHADGRLDVVQAVVDGLGGLVDRARLDEADDCPGREVVQQARAATSQAGRGGGQVVAVDGVGAALTVQVDAADGFHLIAKKLHADCLRRTGREDVHDAAAAGEVALLLYLLDALEARVHQPGDQLLDVLDFPPPQRLPRRRQGRCRRHRLHQRHHRRDDHVHRFVPQIGGLAQQVAQAEAGSGDVVVGPPASQVRLPGRKELCRPAGEDFDVVGGVVGLIEMGRHHQHGRAAHPPDGSGGQRGRGAPYAGQLHRPPGRQGVGCTTQQAALEDLFKHISDG